MAHRQAAGGGGAGARLDSSAVVGKNMVSEGLAHRSSLKHWSRRYKLVAGARDERFKVLQERGEAWDRTSSGSRGQQHSKCNAVGAAT